MTFTIYLLLQKPLMLVHIHFHKHSSSSQRTRNLCCYTNTLICSISIIIITVYFFPQAVLINWVKLPPLHMRTDKPFQPSLQLSRQKCVISWLRLGLTVRSLTCMFEINSLPEIAFLHLLPVWQKSLKLSPTTACGITSTTPHLCVLLESLVLAILK